MSHDHQLVASRRTIDASSAPQKRRAAAGHGLQHRLHVGRRLRDDAQHFGRRRLLLERFAQLGGAVLDPLLERRIGFLAAPRPSG